MLWIERQKMLKPEDNIGEDNPNQTKDKEGNGVLFPALLCIWFYSNQSVKKFFKGTHDRSKESFLLCLQNLKKIESHWFGQNQEYPDKHSQLNPSKKIHRYTFSLKPLWSEYGYEEISNQNQASYADYHLNHISKLLQLYRMNSQMIAINVMIPTMISILIMASHPLTEPCE
jgi:hypothetical protein